MIIKRLFLFLPVLMGAFLSLGNSLQAESLLKPGDLVGVCGDSITEQRLYSAYIEQYLLMCQPQENLMAMQFGWGGEKAPGFAERINNDVLVFKPSVVTTCYGMNDGGYAAVTDPVRQVYREALTDAVKQFKKGGVRTIIVGSPGVVDPASYKRPGATPDEYNRTLKALADTARDVAAAEGVSYADVYTPMMDGMTKAKAALGPKYQIAPDGVHPFGNGHLLMAYAFLKAMGCDGGIGTITVDYAGGKAESDAGQKVLGYKDGTVEMESQRYPFCLSGKAGDTDTRAMAAFIPFNEELNRYQLIVKGAPAKAKVTWGTESHVFTAEQLAKGINLAAEFEVSPFQVAFSNGVAAVAAQQSFEQKNIKGSLHSLLVWQREFPELGANIDPFRAAVLKKSGELRAASRAAVMPVKHAIKIEPEI